MRAFALSLRAFSANETLADAGVDDASLDAVLDLAAPWFRARRC